MSSIINKLLGKDDSDHSHGHKADVKVETHSSSTTHGAHSDKSTHHDEHKSGAHVIEGQAVQRDGVNIKSTIVTEGNTSVSLANQQRLSDLVTKLGSTHSQIDTYAKNQSEKIDEQVQREIDEVVGRIRREQDELLRKANEKTADIDREYQARLKAMVEEVDAAKAKRIAEIEVDLNHQQAGILQAAKNEIDELNKKAARLKIGVLQAAEAKVAQDARNILAQADLGQASTIHQAQGTTTIKTEVSGGASTNVSSGSSSGSAGHSAGTHGTVHASSTGGAGGATVSEVASSSVRTGDAKTVETRQSHSSNQ